MWFAPSWTQSVIRATHLVNHHVIWRIVRTFRLSLLWGIQLYQTLILRLRAPSNQLQKLFRWWRLRLLLLRRPPFRRTPPKKQNTTPAELRRAMGRAGMHLAHRHCRRWNQSDAQTPPVPEGGCAADNGPVIIPNASKVDFGKKPHTAE